jgi:hypothetical protein
MASGTSCTFWARRVAVTTMLSPASASDAGASAAEAAAADSMASSGADRAESRKASLR